MTMKLLIEEKKITEYLLKPAAKADKSQFLIKIGYDIFSWEKLRKDIISQFSNYEAEIYDENEYGTLYKIDGKLHAPLKTVDLTTVWISIPDIADLKLVTLFPNKKSKK